MQVHDRREMFIFYYSLNLNNNNIWSINERWLYNDEIINIKIFMIYNN
jgi:hypothetical protein